MRFALALAIAVALVLAAAAGDAARASEGGAATVLPTEDLSLPFWCDWGYDWEERCYREDSDRLPVGGETDKVWRAALRFSLGALPPDAEVVTAELRLWYDATCVAPRRTTRTCDGRSFQLDAHPILTPRWLAEREVDIGPRTASAFLTQDAPSGWVVLDVTELVADWLSGRRPNSGLLVKVADGEEEFDSSGPMFPSSSFADASRRPHLTISYADT